MRWLELSLELAAEDVEPVAELFRRYGHGGVAIEENLIISEDGDSYSVNPRKPVLIKTYLPLDKAARRRKKNIADGLRYLSMIHPFSPLTEKDLAEEDWANAWKEHFHIHRIGERLVVKPSWREYVPVDGDVIIEIDPGMAFGTGLHPSTRLCLVALEKLLRPGTRVLDLGAGSGILAIAAARLGAASVLALDTDSVAVAAATENVKANGLEGSIEVRQGTLGPKQGAIGLFHVILANIIARVIIELAEEMLRCAAPGGLIVCGGILDERLEEVVSRFESLGASVREVSAEDDWRTVVVEAPG